jgi:1-aminocyclopropane-1-carboxylate deaminase/D-cysteine desulfhydrase-like pyridoxal-dependent ACC family enzyme
MMPFQAALERLAAVPALDLWAPPSPVHDLSRLRAALGGGPRLIVKRDDAIPFGFGGNKVRKIAIVAASALAEGADTLMSVGGVQSNSARVVAAVAARAGL